MHDLINHINHNYQLNILPETEKITAGFLSHNYKVTTSSGQNYFLKQHRHTDEQLVKQVATVEEFFSSHDIPIILPLKDKNSQVYFKYQDRFYSIYPFIQGKTLHRDKITNKGLHQMGEMLARIHQAGKNANTNTFTKRSSNLKLNKFYDRYESIENAIKQTDLATEFDKTAYQVLTTKLQLSQSLKWDDNQLAMPYDHLIHGDFQEQNIFFDEKEIITHVFDLEKAEIAPRLFELVRSIDYVCFNNGYSESIYQKALIYRDAYHKDYPIPQEELVNTLNAYVFSKIHDTWILNEHYINKSNRVDVFLSFHAQAINYLKDNYQTWIKKLSGSL